MFVGTEPLIAFVLWMVPATLWVVRRVRARQQKAAIEREPVREREVIYAQLPFKRFSVEKVDIERVKVGAQDESDGAPADTHVGLKMDSLLRSDAGHVLVPVKGFDRAPAWIYDSRVDDSDYWTVCIN